MIKIAIVEDNDTDAQTLSAYLKKYEQEANISFEIKRYELGLDFISEYCGAFDVIFMDIDLPFINGMETAKKMRKMDSNACLIFTTNLPKYAVKGYEVDAIAFMIKPIKYFDLVLALRKALRIVERNKSHSIVVPYDGGKLCLALKDVVYVEVLSHQLIYHTINKNYSIFGSLNAIEKTLLDYGFIKPFRSYIVNPRYITEVKVSSICLEKEDLPISRNKKKEVMELMMKYWGGQK